MKYDRINGTFNYSPETIPTGQTVPNQTALRTILETIPGTVPIRNPPSVETIPNQTALRTILEIIPGTIPTSNLPPVETIPPAVLPKRGRGRPRKYPFDLSYAAQVINPDEKDAKQLNKRIQ